MSIKMMPPKKSKAARTDNMENNEKVEDKRESIEPTPEPEDEPELPVKKKHFNIFDVTTVEGKRKRLVYTPESSVQDWIAEHFEEKSEVKLPLGEVYTLYLEKCVAEASTAVEQVFFNKIIRQKFPTGYTFKESSPLAHRVKEKKVKKKEPKVKADTLTLKIRDIIENSLNDMGNPAGGIRFNKLLTYIAGKYPALRIELRPKVLLAALQRGIRFGYLVCERGIGKCGFYRRFVGDEDVKPVHSNEKSKDNKDDNEKEDKDEEKSAEESAEEGKEKEEKKDEDKNGTDQKATPAKKAKKRSSRPQNRFIHHGNPSRLEDTFYLAMTFMSEPKEASVIRIKKYVAENYPDTNVERLGRCLEAGKEKGYWEQVSGSSANSGRFRLEVDSFDPTDDEDMTGMVINAIMACTEPKMCSANLLKKYVVEWYSDRFKVEERPQLFKKALERAVVNQEIKQLSGIGASGTFQLVKQFCPSPLILAGQDTPSDYEVSESESSDSEAVESYDFSGYGDKYKPRPSRRRGMARIKAVHAKPPVEVTEEIKRKPKRKAHRQAIRAARKRGRHADSDSSDESSSEEEEESSESSSEASSVEAAPPKRSNKRKAPAQSRAKAASGGKKPKGRSTAAAAPAPAAQPRKPPAKRTPRSSKPTDSSDEDSSSDMRAPRRVPLHSNKSKPSAKSTQATNRRSQSKTYKKPNYRDSSSDASDMDEGPKVVDGYKPTPSRSRGGDRARPSSETSPARSPHRKSQPIPSGRVRTPAAKKQGDSHYNSDSGTDMSDKIPQRPMVETPAAKKQRSAPAPKPRGRKK